MPTKLTGLALLHYIRTHDREGWIRHLESRLPERSRNPVGVAATETPVVTGESATGRRDSESHSCGCQGSAKASPCAAAAAVLHKSVAGTGSPTEANGMDAVTDAVAAPGLGYRVIVGVTPVALAADAAAAGQADAAAVSGASLPTGSEAAAEPAAAAAPLHPGGSWSVTPGAEPRLTRCRERQPQLPPDPAADADPMLRRLDATRRAAVAWLERNGS